MELIDLTKTASSYSCPAESQASCSLVMIDGVPHLRLGDACDLWAYFQGMDRPSRNQRLLLDETGSTLSYQSRTVSLTRVEFRLVATLVREQGRLLSYDELANIVWGPQRPNANLLRAHVRNIRVKLRAAGLPDQLIESVRGQGLRLASHAGGS